MTETAGSRAAVLARVSSGGQATGDRQSLPMQRRMMEQYAEREALTIVEVFEIPGESAFTPELSQRPQFLAAIEAAERGAFDVLLVYDLSRFARDQRVLHECLHWLRRANVRLVGVHNGIDYTSDEGRDWAGLEGMMAERASREQGRRIRHAKDQRFERGLPVGDTPFGYRRIATDLPPEVIPEEAEAIRWAFGEYANGLGFQAIASEWNRRGLRPRSKRGLQTFGVSSVQSIIESRFYVGCLTHLGRGAPRRPRAHSQRSGMAGGAVENQATVTPPTGVRRTPRGVGGVCGVRRPRLVQGLRRAPDGWRPACLLLGTGKSAGQGVPGGRVGLADLGGGC
ncbi:MAG: recombinase family protein [Dehalococcoidia bacterium]|nr:recombinase family protein [Dehalococcoidia bacterium]